MSQPKELRIELGALCLCGVATSRGLLGDAGKRVVAHDGAFSALVELDGVDAWLKSDAVFERARLRMSVRRWLGVAAPCVVEYRNLLWLRTHGFRAPEPLAAGVLLDGIYVRRQLLATRWLGEHRTLEQHLRTASGPERRARLDELARELARLHALGFVHRDLFLRNLLVDDAPGIVLIDCRRGGRGRPLRDASYDLGCLMLEGAGVLALDEQREVFTRYFAERAAHGMPGEPAATLAAANRARGALLERIAHAPSRWRSASPPLAHWPWREISS